jgi:hypothetical protein
MHLIAQLGYLRRISSYYVLCNRRLHTPWNYIPHPDLESALSYAVESVSDRHTGFFRFNLGKPPEPEINLQNSADVLMEDSGAPFAFRLPYNEKPVHYSMC